MQPARVDLGGRVGDPVLHRLLVRERPAERLALERVRAHELERALHLAEPAHDVVDPARPEPLLRDPEAVARLAEHVLDRHAHPRVAHLAVRRPAAAAVAHGRDRAEISTPGRVGRDDDLARAPVRLGVWIGDGHDDRERRSLGARREPLVPVDHPLVAVVYRARLQRRRVGSGTSGSVIEKNDRTSPATSGRAIAPSARRPEQVEDLAVARVRRLAVEDELRVARAADLLVQCA